MHKIIQVVPSLSVGGAETLVKEYSIVLNSLGYDVEILVTGKRSNTIIEQELFDKNIHVTYLNELYRVNHILPDTFRHYLVAFKWRRAIKNYFKEKKPDVVHCHLAVAHNLVHCVENLKQCRVFYTVHSDPDKYWADNKNSDDLSAIKNLINKCDMQVIALHNGMIPKLRKYLGESIHIHVLNNAVDFSRYKRSSGHKNVVLDSIGIPNDGFIVGHIGRFSRPKNHLFLIEIFQKILEKNKKAYLLLAGDGELKPEIEALVTKLSLNKHVYFLGNVQNIPELLAAFDVFLFPSLWEGFPLTLIESQVAGVRCIVSDSITKDVLLTNKIEMISLDKSADYWADRTLDESNETYIEYGLEKYNLQNIIQELLKLYRGEL